MTEFEEYIINKVDKINSKVHSIDKKLAYFAGGVTVVATACSILITKLF